MELKFYFIITSIFYLFGLVSSAINNDQCQPVKCNGVLLVGKYAYKAETVTFNKAGKNLKIDVKLFNELMDTFYNDKPIPLLETYKFIAEILNENPVLFQFLLSLDLKKYKLNDVIAPVIWAFFADPSKNLNKAKKTQVNDKSKDKAEQLLSVLISKLINAFSENERTLLNLRDFLQEQLDKDNDLVIYIRDFINVFLAQYKDSKDKLRKLILKMVVALEVMKADKKSDDVANQQDQLVKLIKNFFAASPRLKVKIVDLVVDVQTMHSLIPSNLYTKLGFK